MTATLLMIEDDSRLADMVREYLSREGFTVSVSGSGAAGLAWLEQHHADLVILDLMLPDGGGLDVCRAIRRRGQLPILILSARGDAADRIVGLEIGADDYLPKPFEPRELLARVRAVLRRRHPDARVDALRFGRLELDRDARVVRVDGHARQLTARQFRLLAAMAERAGRVLTRDQLMEVSRDDSGEAYDRSIDVQVARIRAAIEDDPRHPRRIITVRGAGYVFSRAPDG
ncbi:MAG: response regulator transcription factor [Burkholderiales bacterium]|nr:response regulator transcription factor [Burkholderiales bacterium]